MKQIYLLSGLGADYRVLQDLDFSGYDTTLLNGLNRLKMKVLKRMPND